jgi:hypothetical protein
MEHIEMLSIDGLEFAVLGTGHTISGQEVLVYDGYAVETVDFSIVDYENELVEAGMEHMAPIFIYLDQGVRAEVCRTNRDVH